jgi:P27 family predicted phage terminase small subunit
MAPRGQKPKPTHLKLVLGNPGKRALPKNEPMPEAILPPVPPELCDDAKLEWGRVSIELFKLGLLTGIDRAALAAYCAAWGRWVRAERALRKLGDEWADGLLTRTAQGNVIQNPLLGISNKAARDLVAYAEQFGMTPSSRARVNGGGAGEKEADPANKYFS